MNLTSVRNRREAQIRRRHAKTLADAASILRAYGLMPQSSPLDRLAEDLMETVSRYDQCAQPPQFDCPTRGPEMETPAPTPPPPPLYQAVESGIFNDLPTERRLDQLRQHDEQLIFSVSVKGPDPDGNFMVLVRDPDRSLAQELVCSETDLNHEMRTVLPALREHYADWSAYRGREA